MSLYTLFLTDADKPILRTKNRERVRDTIQKYEKRGILLDLRMLNSAGEISVWQKVAVARTSLGDAMFISQNRYYFD